jgi:hypothetical protein
VGDLVGGFVGDAVGTQPPLRQLEPPPKVVFVVGGNVAGDGVAGITISSSDGDGVRDGVRDSDGDGQGWFSVQIVLPEGIIGLHYYYHHYHLPLEENDVLGVLLLLLLLAVHRRMKFWQF